MNIEQLLQCSASQLEAMTDKELEEHLSPYFSVTRPSEEQKKKALEQQQNKSVTVKKPSKRQEQENKMMEACRKLGLDL